MSESGLVSRLHYLGEVRVYSSGLSRLRGTNRANSSGSLGLKVLE